MCVALLERETAVRRAPTAESSHEEVLAFLHERNAARRRPRPVCPKCRYPFDRRESGTARRELCASCEARWLDNIVCRLISRHGRKAAIKRLKRLAK